MLVQMPPIWSAADVACTAGAWGTTPPRPVHPAPRPVMYPQALAFLLSLFQKALKTPACCDYTQHMAPKPGRNLHDQTQNRP